MKTAEEWANETGETVMLDCFAGDRNAQPGEPTIKLIKQIQLDAMFSGMMRATKVECPVKPQIGSSMCRDSVQLERTRLRQAILTAAEQLTEKDL